MHLPRSRTLIIHFLLCLLHQRQEVFPLGVVINSAESADVIHKGMTELFPESAFYGNSYPENIMIDDSSAECECLHQTWPSSNIFIICTFYFLQNMWRWLLCSKNSILKDERQYLMNLVRKLVYAKKETELNTEYQQFKSNTVANNIRISWHKWKDTGSVEMIGQYALEMVKL